jgi:hypothetical protein
VGNVESAFLTTACPLWQENAPWKNKSACESRAMEQAQSRAMEAVLQRERFEAAKFAKLLAEAPLLTDLVVGNGVEQAGANSSVAGWSGTSEALRAPHRRPAPAVVQLHPRSPSERAPVMPTLFMPGFPKSATTWLYGCLLKAFSPAAVGCGFRASDWGSDKCRHRYILTALQSKRAPPDRTTTDHSYCN